VLLQSKWLVVYLLLYPFPLVSAPREIGTVFKVGAWGDDASRSNRGVQAQIKTHAYESYPGMLDYFWVGDNLKDGSFIQFGYSLEPGVYCLKGAMVAGEFSCLGPSELITDSEARWQWQYWPNRSGRDFYYEIGPASYLGQNDSWHVYTIDPSPSNSWRFALDGRVVANTTFPVSYSIDPVFVLAEKNSASNVTTELGPVEFKNVAYLEADGWRTVDSLVAISTCPTNTYCAENPYGVRLIEANTLVAGSSVPRARDGVLLWTSSYVTLNISVHPDVQFLVTSVLGMNSFHGRARVDVPKGMFAYVSLSATKASTPGVLGLIGAKDQFQGWTGDIQSSNSTAQVLMNASKSIEARWIIDIDVPALVAALALLVAGGFLFLLSRHTRSRLKQVTGH
jgi:hypothetical protein